MKLKEWGAFGLLGLIWGSSFLWIKLAVQDVGPFTLVAFRLLFAVAGLLVIMRAVRQPIPRDPRLLLSFAIMGIFNTGLPFVLISWGETRIDSSLASILNSTVPLFTIVIAHFWLHDEKITPARLAGLLVGFVGVVVLMSRDLQPGALQTGLLGQLAVVVACVSYASALTFARKYLRGQPPVLQSTLSLLVADAAIWLSMPLGEPSFHLPTRALTWVAIAWLGLLGSCLAYLLFYFLNNAWGPTRASLVTYIFPVIGLVLGLLFLHEAADWRLVAGSALIISGIVVVNIRWPARAVAASASSAD